MRGGNCRGGAASETATGRTSSVGAGGTAASTSGAASATGSSAMTAAGALVSVAAATTGAARQTALAFRLRGTRLTLGARGRGSSEIGADRAGDGTALGQRVRGHHL